MYMTHKNLGYSKTNKEKTEKKEKQTTNLKIKKGRYSGGIKKALL